MTQTELRSARRSLTHPALWLGLLAISAMVVGFYVGDLAQRVARAHELLSPRSRASAPEIELLAQSLEATARALYATRRWLVLLGLSGSLLTAASDETPRAFRLGIPVLAVVCFMLLFLSRGLP